MDYDPYSAIKTMKTTPEEEAKLSKEFDQIDLDKVG